MARLPDTPPYRLRRLAIAVLFLPLRRRILTAFSANLRDEVDQAPLTGNLVAVVEDTLSRPMSRCGCGKMV